MSEHWQSDHFFGHFITFKKWPFYGWTPYMSYFGGWLELLDRHGEPVIVETVLPDPRQTSFWYATLHLLRHSLTTQPQAPLLRLRAASPRHSHLKLQAGNQPMLQAIRPPHSQLKPQAWGPHLSQPMLQGSCQSHNLQMPQERNLRCLLKASVLLRLLLNP